jgi:hypothetical protein
MVDNDTDEQLREFRENLETIKRSLIDLGVPINSDDDLERYLPRKYRKSIRKYLEESKRQVEKSDEKPSM